jgi:hypothetical protein
VSVVVGTTNSGVGSELRLAGGASTASTGGSVVLEAGSGSGASGRISLVGALTLGGSFRSTILTVAEGATTSLSLSFGIVVVRVTAVAGGATQVNIPSGATASADGFLLTVTRESHSVRSSVLVKTSSSDLYSVDTSGAGVFANGATLTDAGDFVELMYDSSSVRWIVLSHRATFSFT